VGLEFSEVVELAAGPLLLGVLEDDDPAGVVPQCNVVALAVELERGDDVLLLDWLLRPLVAEDLAEPIAADPAAFLLHASVLLYLEVNSIKGFPSLIESCRRTQLWKTTAVCREKQGEQSDLRRISLPCASEGE
jgi:hypothetical protein